MTQSDVLSNLQTSEFKSRKSKCLKKIVFNSYPMHMKVRFKSLLTINEIIYQVQRWLKSACHSFSTIVDSITCWLHYHSHNLKCSFFSLICRIYPKNYPITIGNLVQILRKCVVKTKHSRSWREFLNLTLYCCKRVLSAL